MEEDWDKITIVTKYRRNLTIQLSYVPECMRPAGANVLLMMVCFTPNFLLDDSQKGPKSHLEILAEMRDYKRRRQSYRAKNVHITKKSYTEVRLGEKRLFCTEVLIIYQHKQLYTLSRRNNTSLLLVSWFIIVANSRGMVLVCCSK